MKPLPLTPGLLVGLSVRDVGKQVSYQKTELGESRDGETVVATWETRKETVDEAEFKKAAEVRSRARYLVASICIQTRFGGLMIFPTGPDDKPGDIPEKLNAACREAEGLIEGFNATAHHSRLDFKMLCGQMFESKARVMQAVRSEIQGLLDQLAQAAKLGDVKSLRDAAKNARGMSQTLAEGSAEKGAIGEAIEAARALARQVVKRVEKGTEQLEAVATEAALAPIMSARFVFAEEFEGGPYTPVIESVPGVNCPPFPVVDSAFQASVDAEHGQTGIFDFDETEPEPPSDPAGLDFEDDEPFTFNRPDAAPFDPLAGEETADLLPFTSRILHALAAALKEFRAYAFDDKGPDEVMELGDFRAEVRKLSPADAARCRAELLSESQRGQDLVDALFPEDLPAAPAAGVTLTLGNAASVLSAFKGAAK